MRKLNVLFIFAVLMCFFSAPVKAELITINISGYVTSISDPYNHFGGQIVAGTSITGTPITGTYTYDSSVPDSYPSDFSYGQYWNYTTPAGISLNIGEFKFETNPANVEFSVTVNNDDLGVDRYSIWSTKNLSTPNGTMVQNIAWNLSDSAGTALSSDALPLIAPDLSKWHYNNLVISHDRDYGIQATITSATPEPATMFLFGLGLMFVRKRFSK